jgi:adenylate cyclase
VNAPDRQELARRLRQRFIVSVIAANVVGALVCFLFLNFVVPRPDDRDTSFLVVALMFVGYLAASIPIGFRWSNSLAAPISRWMSEDRPPTPAERARTLEFPFLGFKVMGTLWAGAALFFGGYTALSSAAGGALVAFTLALGGATTCAVGVLLAERLGREAAALALEAGVPEEPIGPRVGSRMLVAWGLGTGIPLVGLGILAVAVLFGADVSAERLAATALFLALIGMVVGLVVVRIAGNLVAEPVEEVRTALAEVERGNLEARARVSDGTEVGLLAAGFNRMTAGLRERERLRDLFGRHVGRDVARVALDGEVRLGGEVRDVAALFVDVVGSTSLAASRPPTEVVSMLNDFFHLVVQTAERNRGWVNKFEGDAALCVFGAPTAQEDPAGDALRAARKLRERLDSELPEVQAGIGVSAGPAVAGNVGAEERFEYTVIGDPVNEAARLCELAKHRPERLLASEVAVSSARDDERRCWELGEAVVLRGRAEPTRLATPLGLASPNVPHH